MLILSWIAAIVIEIAIICNKSLARTVPVNYCLLGAFTFCEAYMVASICTFYDPFIVLTAAAMTAGAVGGLTYYAWTTKEDFTIMRGLFSLMASALLIALVMVIFMTN